MSCPLGAENLGSLQEQQALVTTKPPRQPCSLFLMTTVIGTKSHLTSRDTQAQRNEASPPTGSIHIRGKEELLPFWTIIPNPSGTRVLEMSPSFRKRGLLGGPEDVPNSAQCWRWTSWGYCCEGGNLALRGTMLPTQRGHTGRGWTSYLVDCLASIATYVTTKL